MNATLIFLILYAGLVSSQLTRYQPRGWRPNGRQFSPGGSAALHSQYGPPPTGENSISYLPPPSSTIAPPVTTTTAKITTTERSREPTTQPSTGVPEESFDTNPALAIANSFAFNRPVYVYNTFPFLPAQLTLVK